MKFLSGLLAIFGWPDEGYNDKFPEYSTEGMLDEQVWFPW